MKLPNSIISQWDMTPFSACQHFVKGLNSGKLSEEMECHYCNSLDLIKKYMTEVPMPQSWCLWGQTKVFITHLGCVFVDSKGKQQCVLEGDCTIMFWLLKLYNQESISRHQQEKIMISGQCAICVYNANNHVSVNSHVQAHYRMGLICAFCYQIEVSMAGMVSHGEGTHSIVLKGDEPKKVAGKCKAANKWTVPVFPAPPG